jgi:hypothetical protein
LEILDIVAADPTVEVGSFEFCAEGAKGSFVPLKITKFKERRREAIGREEKERAILEGMRHINDIPHKLVFETVQVGRLSRAFRFSSLTIFTSRNMTWTAQRW